MFSSPFSKQKHLFLGKSCQSLQLSPSMKKNHGNINILVKRLLSTIFRGELHLSSTPKELDQWHLHAYASVALGAAQPVQFQTDLVEGSQRVDVTGPWTTTFSVVVGYPLVFSPKTRMGKPPFLMGKSTNFLWPCSIAMLVCQRPFGGGLDLVNGSKKTMIYGISPIIYGIVLVICI